MLRQSEREEFKGDHLVALETVGATVEALGRPRLNCRRPQRRPTKATSSTLPRVGQPTRRRRWPGFSGGRNGTATTTSSRRTPAGWSFEAYHERANIVPALAQLPEDDRSRQATSTVLQRSVVSSDRGQAPETVAPRSRSRSFRAANEARPASPNTFDESSYAARRGATTKEPPTRCPPPPVPVPNLIAGGAGGGPTVPLVPAQLVSRAWETGAGGEDCGSPHDAHVPSGNSESLGRFTGVSLGRCAPFGADRRHQGHSSSPPASRDSDVSRSPRIAPQTPSTPRWRPNGTVCIPKGRRDFRSAVQPVEIPRDYALLGATRAGHNTTSRQWRSPPRCGTAACTVDGGKALRQRRAARRGLLSH